MPVFVALLAAFSGYLYRGQRAGDRPPAPFSSTRRRSLLLVVGTPSRVPPPPRPRKYRALAEKLSAGGGSGQPARPPSPCSPCHRRRVKNRRCVSGLEFNRRGWFLFSARHEYDFRTRPRPSRSRVTAVWVVCLFLCQRCRIPQYAAVPTNALTMGTVHRAGQYIRLSISIT